MVCQNFSQWFWDRNVSRASRGLYTTIAFVDGYAALGEPYVSASEALSFAYAHPCVDESSEERPPFLRADFFHSAQLVVGQPSLQPRGFFLASQLRSHHGQSLRLFAP